MQAGFDLGVLLGHFGKVILISKDAAIKWAGNILLHGENPKVNLVEDTYEKGVVVGKKELKKFDE
jgi:hypothetical protein